MKLVLFAVFSQRQHRWSVFTELDRDEHVQIFHVDCGLLGCVDRPIRRDHRRGTSRHFDCFQFFWWQVHLAHHMHGCTRINNKLFLVRIDGGGTLHAIFGLKNVASFSRYASRIKKQLLVPFPRCFAGTIFCHNVLFGSLFAKVCASGLLFFCFVHYG